jgi:hypothetical protein
MTHLSIGGDKDTAMAMVMLAYLRPGQRLGVRRRSVCGIYHGVLNSLLLFATWELESPLDVDMKQRKYK